MQRRILLNHDSKHWCQSLSSSAQGSPWYAANMPSGVENRFPVSLAFTVGNRKKSPRCQVWTIRRMGQQLHRSPLRKPIIKWVAWAEALSLYNRMPLSPALGCFLAIFGEHVGGQLWCTAVQSLSFDAQVVLVPHDHLQQRK